MFPFDNFKTEENFFTVYFVSAIKGNSYVSFKNQAINYNSKRTRYPYGRDLFVPVSYTHLDVYKRQR